MPTEASTATSKPSTSSPAFPESHARRYPDGRASVISHAKTVPRLRGDEMLGMTLIFDGQRIGDLFRGPGNLEIARLNLRFVSRERSDNSSPPWQGGVRGGRSVVRAALNAVNLHEFVQRQYVHSIRKSARCTITSPCKEVVRLLSRLDTRESEQADVFYGIHGRWEGEATAELS